MVLSKLEPLPLPPPPGNYVLNLVHNVALHGNLESYVSNLIYIFY